MQVTVEPINLQLPFIDNARSSGIHISSVIKCIAIEGDLLKSEDIDDLSLYDTRIITEPDSILRIWIGCAWEAFYLPRVKDVAVHPGEYRLDGIYLSPDGESVDCYARPLKVMRRIHEVKATYKSIKTVNNLMDPYYAKRNWMWLAQLKSYCLAAETVYAVLHVLFLCGNYRFPIKPQLRKFNIAFEQWELEENWNLMKDYVTYKIEDPHLYYY
jgi:hypothetical protein